MNIIDAFKKANGRPIINRRCSFIYYNSLHDILSSLRTESLLSDEWEIADDHIKETMTYKDFQNQMLFWKINGREIPENAIITISWLQQETK